MHHPFTREDVLAIIDSTHPGGPLAAEAAAFAEAILKKDRKDPRLRLYLHRYHRSEYDPPGARRKDLKAIHKEAVLRKDDFTLQAVLKELDALDMVVPPPPIDSFYDDRADLDEIARSLFDSDSSPNPDDRKMLLEIKEFLQHASQREIREFQKIRPKGMPEEVFDMLLELLLNRADELEPVPERPAPRRRKSRQSHPNQGSLFEI
jgi:hypothetical protein